MTLVLTWLYGTGIALAETPVEDPHLWLEDIDAESSLDWVRARNQRTVDNVANDDGFQTLQDQLMTIYDSKDRIPYVSKQGDYFYNFWKDTDHPRGVWRRTTLESYKSDEPTWETILDLDALSEKENENWVWHGADCLQPAEVLCMVALSRGGADADVKREFSINNKAFVEDGFFLPEAKSEISWVNNDTLLISTDFGEGSLTDSGYPRVTKTWSRGTELSEASTLYEGTQKDVWVGAYHDPQPEYERTIVYQGLTFYSNNMFIQTKDGLVKIDKQESANASLWKNTVLIELREDWTIDGKTYIAGSLLSAPLKKWLRGKKKISVLFTPDEKSSLARFSTTKDHLLLTILRDVKTEIEVWTPSRKAWVQSEVQGIPSMGQLRITPMDANNSNDYWLTVRDYITPNTLYTGSIGLETPPVELKKLPEFFDANNLVVNQHFATSKDGTKVPYFEVARSDVDLDGENPTLLYGYGGFEVSLLPSYSASVGTAWLAKGGVYVVANIRGGGEYGPTWHQAALKENRHRAYEDFAAVGEDLVGRGVTRPSKLGIQGGSNGGLLMGNMYTLYPDHWGAIVCQVPLLDMKRYTKLLAGASWAGEYGNPDVPEEWEFIQTFSPYHNLDASMEHPPMLITTSTRDDRVHPGHARKMTALLESENKDVLYYENMEGGHGGSANNEQAAFMNTLAYSFLWNTLTAEPPASESTEESIDAVPE